MTNWDFDQAIATLARRQHLCWSWQQARTRGGTPRMLRDRLANGRWVELDHRVFTFPCSPGTWERQCMAATLAIPRSAIAYESAATLHGLTGFRPGRLHLVAPAAEKRRSRLADVTRATDFAVTSRVGIRVVTAADTLVMLAGRVPDAALARALDDAVAADARILPAVHDRYVELAHSRRRGLRRLEPLLEVRGEGYVPPQSELEHLLVELFRAVEGVPAWELQPPLPWWARGAGRADAGIHEWRLLVEADGRRWHTRAEDFERDHDRDNLAAVHGYDVMRFTHHKLTARWTEAVATLAAYAELRRRRSA